MKTSIPIRILILSTLLLASTLKSNATDLRVADLLAPYSIFLAGNLNVLGIPDEGEYRPLGVVVENVNILTAVNYTVIVTVKNKYKNVVFQETIQGSNLAPYSSDTLFTKNWELKQNGVFSVTTEVVFADDINLSNNSIDWGLQVLPSLRTSTEYALARLVSFGNLSYETGDLKVPVFAPPTPLVPGTVISSRPPGEDSIRHDTVDFFSWFFYAPHVVSDKLVQPADLVIVNAEDETVSSMSTELPP